MNKCSVCGSIESIVHSGVDALLLECLDRIGEICYTCANAEREKVAN
jgi:translation initiation factor 2 beta subunit (eIF-2beta)/eIF-5